MSLAACQAVPYLAHVGVGQMRLLLDRELLTPELEAELTEQERRGLQTLHGALDFAESLGLARSTSHRHLVDRGGRGLATIVTGSPRDRLEPTTWWFPIVGRIAYRGYFDPERAKRFARSMESRGLDTYVRSALLYSTLGWFDDPVPRGLLRMEPYEISETILHERTHETIFVPGDTPYNEALAVLVAHEAVLRLYADQPQVGTRAARSYADAQRFGSLLDRLAQELETLYGQSLPSKLLLEGREKIFERYRRSEFESVAWETERYADFPRAPLSNAYVVALRTYLGDLPCLRAELEAQSGDLPAFIQAHRERSGRRTDADGTCPFGES